MAAPKFIISQFITSLSEGVRQLIPGTLQVVCSCAFQASRALALALVLAFALAAGDSFAQKAKSRFYVN